MPTCMSMLGHDCIPTSGGVSAPHVERIRAALVDRDKKN
jgi:hypothetical protein